MSDDDEIRKKIPNITFHQQTIMVAAIKVNRFCKERNNRENAISIKVILSMLILAENKLFRFTKRRKVCKLKTLIATETCFT